MNYEDMSDFEVNELVAIVTGQVGKIGLVKVSNGKITDSSLVVKDYCNNPSDAWGIIVENKIGITHGSQMCSAVTVTDNELIQIPCTPSELLRAAMICFLKMKDAEK